MCARKIFSNLHSYPPKYQMVHPLLQRHCRLMFAYLSKCYTSIFCDISETLKDGQVRTSKHCPSFLSFFLIEIKDSRKWLVNAGCTKSIDFVQRSIKFYQKHISWSLDWFGFIVVFLIRMHETSGRSLIWLLKARAIPNKAWRVNDITMLGTVHSMRKCVVFNSTVSFQDTWSKSNKKLNRSCKTFQTSIEILVK